MRVLVFIIMLLSSFPAAAACAALPTGAAAVLRLGGAAGTGGVYGSDATNLPSGSLAWDSAAGTFKYCDGNNWLQLASGGGSAAEKIYAGVPSSMPATLCATLKTKYTEGRKIHFSCTYSEHFVSMEADAVAIRQETAVMYGIPTYASSYTYPSKFTLSCNSSPRTARFSETNQTEGGACDNIEIWMR